MRPLGALCLAFVALRKVGRFSIKIKKLFKIFKKPKIDDFYWTPSNFDSHRSYILSHRAPKGPIRKDFIQTFMFWNLRARQRYLQSTNLDFREGNSKMSEEFFTCGAFFRKHCDLSTKDGSQVRNPSWKERISTQILFETFSIDNCLANWTRCFSLQGFAFSSGKGLENGITCWCKCNLLYVDCPNYLK